MPKPRRKLPVLAGILAVIQIGLFSPSRSFGSPVNLTVTPAQSNMSVTLCLAGGCDTDTSPVAGHIIVGLDCLTAPTTISIHDFDFLLTETIDLHINRGIILGRLDATGTGIEVFYASPGTPRPPVPMTAGQFVDSGVPVDADGTLSYAATGGVTGLNICALLTAAGYACSATIDLDTIGINPIDMSGTLTRVNRQLTLSTHIHVETPLDPANPSIGMLTLDGNIVATGAVTLPGISTFAAALSGQNTQPDLVCESDINLDGRTDGRDVQAYVQALLH